MGTPDEYYQGLRTDIVALIPERCKKVLDIGCGFGGLGRLLRQRSECEVSGVEQNPAADAHLQEIYSRYWIGDIEKIELPVDADYFDCVVFADVLEHLADPWAVLERYSRYAKRGGVIIASIPNVRNFGLLYNLVVKGRWRYEQSGLLDRSHLRFFTRKEIIDLFVQAGLEIDEILTNRDRYSLWKRIAAAIPTALVPDLAVCQFLVRARRP